MVYILFGPPGVGKTYIGQLLSKKLGYHFFDADSLYTDWEIALLQSGKYDQLVRDKFIKRLYLAVKDFVADKEKNTIIAEAFTKQKNRMQFLESFDREIKFILVVTSKNLAEKRIFINKIRKGHAINKRAFDLIWEEFDLPMIPHEVIDNVSISDKELVKRFKLISSF